MKNLKTLQSELNTIKKALHHLADYQSVFEYDEQSEEEWNSIQRTMRELYVMKMIAETKTDLRKNEWRKMKKLLDDFNNEYDFLYSNRDRVAGYEEAVTAFDRFLATPQGKELVQAFIAYRGDVISSDREAAAFMFAL